MKIEFKENVSYKGVCPICEKNSIIFREIKGMLSIRCNHCGNSLYLDLKKETSPEKPPEQIDLTYDDI